jgi:hypothetical protein
MTRHRFFPIAVFCLIPLFTNGVAQNRSVNDSPAQATEMILERSQIVTAGGYRSNGSFQLIDQFGVGHMGQMKNDLFIIGPATEVICMDEEAEIPIDFLLSQNYPNPFNASTTFQYALPEKTDIEIAVYTILGQHVVTLVSGVQEPGFYRLTYRGLDGQNNRLPSGIYFCRMSGEHHKRTVKFVLIR